MDIAESGGRTWLLVAAESREFIGILRRFGTSEALQWNAKFAREARYKGDRWLMVANGPGPKLVEQALQKKIHLDGIVSTGFCGALDPALRVGDIVMENTGKSACAGRILSLDRVAVTAAEKARLHEQTGASAIEMESAAVSLRAAEWGVPFYCVKAVSDSASDDMPLDFNLYRDGEGRFSRSRIAMAAMMRPFSVMPALMRLDRNCRKAAESLGDFFADRRF
jgi:adenosylhomocysteine nucleosidase